MHAGLDETSDLLRRAYPSANVRVLDFYDPRVHTEASIRRARADRPPPASTTPISTARLPEAPDSVAGVFLFFAAHEIRDASERVTFFREVARVLGPGGRAFVVEHLRDAPNAAVYTLGVFHFYARSEWLRVFRAAGLAATREIRLTPFVRAFILERS